MMVTMRKNRWNYALYDNDIVLPISLLVAVRSYGSAFQGVCMCVQLGDSVFVSLDTKALGKAMNPYLAPSAHQLSVK